MTVVRLPTPPSSAGAEPKKDGEDAGSTSMPKATTSEGALSLHVVSVAKGINPGEVKRQAEEMHPEKNKENCQVGSLEAESDPLGPHGHSSPHVSEGSQTPDLSQCHEYSDNSQAFSEWKGSSQPPCPKWGPPPYLGGHASGSSGPEGQNNPSDATASTERSCGQGPNVPPFN